MPNGDVLVFALAYVLDAAHLTGPFLTIAKPVLDKFYMGSCCVQIRFPARILAGTIVPFVPVQHHYNLFHQ